MLPAGAYPKNAEMGLSDLYYGDISASYGLTDIWVYESSGIEQFTYYASGYADRIATRQLAVSANLLLVSR